MDVWPGPIGPDAERVLLVPFGCFDGVKILRRGSLRYWHNGEGVLQQLYSTRWKLNLGPTSVHRPNHFNTLRLPAHT